MLLCLLQGSFTISQFQFCVIDGKLLRFLLRPQRQKKLNVPPVNGLLPILVQPPDFPQSLQFFLLTLCQLLMALVIPDILLHSLDIWLLRDIADILCNKLLDVYNGAKGDGLLHHPHNLLVMDIPLCQQIFLVLLMGIIKFSPRTVLFQKYTKSRNINGLALSYKAVLRQSPIIQEEAVLPASVAPTVEDDAADKLLTLHIIQKFTGNKGGVILPAPGIGVIFVHISPQVSVQCPLRLLIGCLVEVPGVGLTQKDDLKRIDHSGFSCSVFSCQEIDILHFDEFFGKIEPINQ